MKSQFERFTESFDFLIENEFALLPRSRSDTAYYQKVLELRNHKGFAPSGEIGLVISVNTDDSTISIQVNFYYPFITVINI